LFCAVASSTTGTYFIMTSPDGANWTSQSSPASQVWGTTGAGPSVCWSASFGLFCAVDYRISGNATWQVITSPDGINWTGERVPTTGTLISKALTCCCASDTIICECGAGVNGIRLPV
jgi:hypothetical protein